MNIEVKPDNWILPNRLGYNDFVYKTFHPSKYPKKEVKSTCECDKDVCDVSTISLFPHQRITRDYMQYDSPYRGVLLYHELGSGKSAASIATIEGYMTRKKIYVFSPASLAQNYENELLKISTTGLNLKKSWTQIKIKSKKDEKSLNILKEYAIDGSIIKKDCLVWVPLYKNDIDEAIITIQNKSYKSLSSDEKLAIDDTIIHIIRNRYTFISYNGLSQKIVANIVKEGFNNSIVVIDEAHNFISRVVNGSKLARSIYNALMAANCKLILLSGTPIINNPYEIATLVNLIRGPMIIYELKLLKGSIEPDNETLNNNLNTSGLSKYVDICNFESNKNNIYISLLPSGFVKNGNNISKEDWTSTSSKIIELIINSFKTVKGLRVGVVPTISNFYALPNDKDTFYKYFIKTNNLDKLEVTNTDLFERRILGLPSFYKTSGTELFPTILSNTIEYLPMTDHQFNTYTEIRKKEREIDDRNVRMGRMKKDIFDKKSSVYRAFSRMVCNFAFPENIKRVFPQDIRKLLKKEIDKVDDDSDDEEIIVPEKDVVKANYDNALNEALEELEEGNYLEKENLGNLYSPKYAKMLDDIKNSKGSVLAYSQFRMVEGIGIFSKCLNKEGYIEIKIKKTENSYIIEDMSVFDEQYDNKRYVIFNSDRVKTNILMNLFNGSFNLLPDMVKEQLETLGNRYKDQLYGRLVKLMMISASGSEGISLKNVRRVLIMEYFWNTVRINQVIGRAIRTCSHEGLPLKDRNVDIITYIMSFTKKQLDKDFTLRTLDKELSTDQYILQLANNKDDIINEFLKMLKISSYDCIINSKQNKPLENGYKCYNWAINANKTEQVYTQNIDDDYKILNHKKYQILKNNKGVVVSKDGVKYVLLNGVLYDYNAYKLSGVLVKI